MRLDSTAREIEYPLDSQPTAQTRLANSIGACTRARDLVDAWLRRSGANKKRVLKGDLEQLLIILKEGLQ